MQFLYHSEVKLVLRAALRF